MEVNSINEAIGKFYSINVFLDLKKLDYFLLVYFKVHSEYMER